MTTKRIDELTAATALTADDLLVTMDAATTTKKITAANARTYFTPDAASDTAAGVVELATSAETITGTDAARAVTPASGAAAYVTKATGTAKGSLVGFSAAATPAEIAVGANGTTPVASSGAASGIAWALRSQLNPIMPNTTDGAFVTAAGSNGSATATTIATAVPFTLVAAATVSAVTIWVSALGASSAVGIAIYGTGTDGRPGSLIYDCGTVATTGTGKKTATLGVAQSLAPGVYWIATSCTTGTPPSLYGMASASSGVVGSAAAGNGLMADNLARAGAYGFITTAGAFTANPTWLLATAIGAVAANFQLTFSSVP